MYWDSVNNCLLTCWPYAAMFNGGNGTVLWSCRGYMTWRLAKCQLPVPGATWIEMTKMQAPQKKGGKQFKARSGQEWTVQVSEVHAVSKETLLLFPPWLSAFSFFSKARQEICRDNLVLVQGSKAKTDSRQKRTKGCKKSPEKIKEKTTTSNPRRGT